MNAATTLQATNQPDTVLIESVEVLIARINVAHAEAQAYAGKAVDRALEAGDLLLLAKTQVPHGQWQSWMKAHCPAISIRTAQDYMRVARELPIEKRSAAFLSVREALRLVTGEEQAPVSTSKHTEPSISFLPRIGEMARFVDDDWEYAITESSDNPGYYWLQRWFNHTGDSDTATVPCTIFRRPMNEYGLNIFLRKWKVIDESWELLGPHDVNAEVIELMGKNAEAEFRRETWPVKGTVAASIE